MYDSRCEPRKSALPPCANVMCGSPDTPLLPLLPLLPPLETEGSTHVCATATQERLVPPLSVTHTP